MINNQFSTPFIVTEDQSIQPLKKVSMKAKSEGFSYDEEWLQNLLFRAPESLPIQEIDSGYQELIAICTELNTPAGPLDVLYVTPQGKLVLLEAKLWRNPEARRKVIGQILDYAKELNKWDYEELQKQVSRRLSKPGNALFEIVQSQYGDTDEANFVDEVSRSLKNGQFMLLIVGDGIREGAGAIAEFLHDVGHLQFALGLVEVGIYEMPNQDIMIQPRILAKTVIVNRSVIELTHPSIQIQHSSEQNVDETVKKEKTSNPFFHEFWGELLDQLELDDKAQGIPNPAKGTSLWFRLIATGKEDAWVNAYFAQSSGCVGIYFRVANNSVADQIYENLALDREQILSELPKNTAWGTERGFRTVGLTLPLNDVYEPAKREEIKDFFAESINQFINTFRYRVDRIIAELSDN